MSSNSNKIQKTVRPRCRATVACEACRSRRSKCVIPETQTDCERCRRNGLSCVIMDTDRRKCPTSRVEVNSLKQRVAYLESVIQKKNELLEPSSPSTHTTDKCENGKAQSNRVGYGTFQAAAASVEHMNASETPLNEIETSQASDMSGEICSSTPEPRLLTNILSTKGHWKYDHSRVHLRYFGSVTNIAVYLDIHASNGSVSLDETRNENGKDVLERLKGQTHDYLLDLYWKYYNSVLHIVSQDAFISGLQNEPGAEPYYSRLLHVCLLAIGFRFADLDRPDMRELLTNNGRDSVLYAEAHHLLSLELDKIGGIPTVQALLLMSDLACGEGKERNGWMYAGMACLQAFDLGLHADCTQIGLSENDIKVRHKVLWACLLVDEYWSLLLGRRPVMRRADLSESVLKADAILTGSEQSLEAITYKATLSLMGISGSIFDIMEHFCSTPPIECYQMMIRLDRELDKWKANLPECLRWNSINTQVAPAGYFLLYQQYYTLLILLHRPFASSMNVCEGEMENGQVESEPAFNHLAIASRKICLDSAVHIARIFKFHTRHFNGRQIMVFGLDHASAAANALIDGIVYVQNEEKQLQGITHLSWIMEAIETISSTYNMARKLLTVLQSVLKENGWDQFLNMAKGAGPVVRREQTKQTSPGSREIGPQKLKWMPPKVAKESSQPNTKTSIKFANGTKALSLSNHQQRGNIVSAEGSPTGNQNSETIGNELHAFTDSHTLSNSGWLEQPGEFSFDPQMFPSSEMSSFTETLQFNENDFFDGVDETIAQHLGIVQAEHSCTSQS